MYPTDPSNLILNVKYIWINSFLSMFFQSLLVFEILMEILSATMKNSLKNL